MKKCAVQKLAELQKNAVNIRNICILAHVDHGIIKPQSQKLRSALSLISLVICSKNCSNYISQKAFWRGCAWCGQSKFCIETSAGKFAYLLHIYVPTMAKLTNKRCVPFVYVINFVRLLLLILKDQCIIKANQIAALNVDLLIELFKIFN